MKNAKFRCIAYLAALGTLATPAITMAGAPCAQWNLGGQWYMTQTNGIALGFYLTQEGDSITGKASWIKPSDVQHILFAQFGQAPSTQVGEIEGTVRGNQVKLRAYWTTNSQIGVYEGTISPQGRIEGTTYDKTRPASRADFFSQGTMDCLEVEKTTSSIPSGPKIKRLVHRDRGSQAVANGSITGSRTDDASQMANEDYAVARGSILGPRPADASNASSGGFMKHVAQGERRTTIPDGTIIGIPPRQANSMPASSPASCQSGFVWRVARPEDKVCVTPRSRDLITEENRSAPQRWNPGGAYGASTCVSGFVWREAFAGDQVCVTPGRRAEVSQENLAGPDREAR